MHTIFFFIFVILYLYVVGIKKHTSLFIIISIKTLNYSKLKEIFKIIFNISSMIYYFRIFILFQGLFQISYATPVFDLSGVYNNEIGAINHLRTFNKGLLRIELENGKSFPPRHLSSNNTINKCVLNVLPRETRCHRYRMYPYLFYYMHIFYTVFKRIVNATQIHYLSQVNLGIFSNS